MDTSTLSYTSCTFSFFIHSRIFLILDSNEEKLPLFSLLTFLDFFAFSSIRFNLIYLTKLTSQLQPYPLQFLIRNNFH